MNSEVINHSKGSSNAWYLWRHSLIALLFSISIIFFFYSNTIAQMVSLWSASDTYAHGFIVPFISLWLIWRVRGKWVVLKPEKSWSGLFLMLGAAGLWLAGDLAAVNAVTQLALVSMIILCVPVLLGWSVAFAITFPLIFLFFSVPIGDFMLPIMMEWTADFTVLALRFTGIPVYREGLQFIIPSGNWSVVEACSGIRYLIASITIGCLFAYINYQSFVKRFVFIVFSIVVPLIANWLRAYLIVLIGHYSGNELATGVDHLIYGWLFFGLVIVLMLFIGARWADEPVYFSNLSEISKKSNLLKNIDKTNNNNYKFVLLIILIIVLPNVLENWFSLKNRKLPVEMENVIVVKPWKKLENAPSDWRPAFFQAAAQADSGFESEAGEQIGLHISYYRKQNYKSKLVSSTNNLISNENKDWIRISRKNQTVFIGKNYLKINDSVLRRKGIIGTEGNQSLHIWHFYWVNGKLTANDVYAKIQGALGQISGNGDDGAIIVVYVPYNSSEYSLKDEESTNKILQKFMKIHADSIVTALQKTRGKN